jgi:hypothetical protein
VRLPPQIPKRLRDAASFLPEMADGEAAWRKRDALRVIESLKSTTVPISDVTPYSFIGDVWITADPVWSLHRLHNESDVDYGRRSRLEAAAFIRNWDGPAEELLFALTFPLFKDAA